MQLNYFIQVYKFLSYGFSFLLYKKGKSLSINGTVCVLVLGFHQFEGACMAAMKSYTVALVANFLLMISNLSCFVKAANQQGIGASFIFGDSLVDAGNNNYLSTLSKANIAPNGIDFKASGGKPTGRYTNGRTIGDIVGKPLSLCVLIL